MLPHPRLPYYAKKIYNKRQMKNRFFKLLLPMLLLFFVTAGASAAIKVEIPNSVTRVGEDAFAYCQYLKKVTIGSNVKYLEKGAFYESPVKDVYVKALTPPKVSSYLFSKKPVIHVHPQALAAYEASEWAQYGTIVGDLDSELK